MKAAAHVATEFWELVRQHRAEALDGWIARAHEPGVPRELIMLANGLKSDYAPVKAALSLPWSNGQMEGQVNRLKLIKRTMYGRAGFELLRKRICRTLIREPL
jgi:transposase